MKYYYLIDRDYMRERYKSEIADLNKEMAECYLFEKYLEILPIFIEPKDQFAGWYGYPGKMPQDLEDFVNHKKEASAKKRQELKEQGDARVIMEDHYVYYSTAYDPGHNLLNYGELIGRGLNSYISEIEDKLQTVAVGSKEENYLKAMKRSLSASEVLVTRYADLAKKMAEEATDEADKARLLRIEKACRKVPMNPAEDFFEAIQSAYLLWTLNSISDYCWISVSYGSFDQYMYPYYLNSKEKGGTDQEAEDLLVELYRKLDQFGTEEGGIDCAISVGGVDEQGNDLTNELSYLIVSAEKRSMRRAPLLAVRVNDKTPSKLLDEVICTQLFEIGQPTFYGEDSCLKAVMQRGIEEKEARKYMINTCMQLEFAGELVESAWGCVTNMHLPLELALNGGKPICGELPIEFQIEPKTEYNSVEEIYEQYRKYLSELFAYLKKWYMDDVENICLSIPNPWLSGVTANCIERACDRWDGGAKYHNVYVENFGFANTADALAAIEQLVFNEGKYTLRQLMDAARNNYQGYEEIHSDILKCPKYGMNHKATDEKARRILSMIAEICEEGQERNIHFLPSLHTLDFEVDRGSRVSATLDGRLAGEPFNKNAGPANLNRSAGPTAVALSACRLNQAKLHGGQALDIHFAVRNMDTPDKRKKVEAFMRTYFAGGGLQLQVNALSSATLKKVYENPKQYPDLIVRIGGHSRYYNDLPDEVKKEFIKRISIEEGTAM